MAESQTIRRPAVRLSRIAMVLPLLTGLPLAVIGMLFVQLSSANVALAGFCIGAVATSIVIADENRGNWVFAPARYALSLFFAALITAMWVTGIFAGIFVLAPIIDPEPILECATVYDPSDPPRRKP